MTKPMYFIGTCALVTATALFVWSQNAAVFHGNAAPAQGSLQAAEAPSSPAETTTNQTKPLPAEQWDAF